MVKTWQTYEENRGVGWTRIDMILAVFDGILKQLDAAQASLARGEAAPAKTAVARAQIGVAALAAGAAGASQAESGNFLRLYEYVCRRLGQPDNERIDDAIRVLNQLREGFEAVHHEARTLERNGSIPPLAERPIFKTSA